MVVEANHLVITRVGHDQVDGRAMPLGFLNGSAQQCRLKRASVDGDDDETGSQPCLVGRAVDDDVGDGAVGPCGEAQRVGRVHAVAFRIDELCPVVGLVGVGELVAGKRVQARGLRRVLLIGVQP